MMSFLLCHECCNWVHPRDSRCPECDAFVDAAKPDPPHSQLRYVLGDVLLRIGEVRVTRRILPDCGTIYATSTGFYFVPHAIEEMTELKEEKVGPSMVWVLASLLFTPLSLVMPFMKSKQIKEVQVQAYRPHWLTEADSARLPELLMENPGAFFVSLRSLRQVQSRGSKWTLERVYGSRIIFKPADQTTLIRERLRQLAEIPSWRSVLDLG